MARSNKAAAHRRVRAARPDGARAGFSPRRAGAVALHALGDLARNPAALASLALCLAFAPFFRWMFESADEGVLDPLVLVSLLAGVGCVDAIVCGIAPAANDDRERGAFGTLARCGVSASEVAAGTALACLAIAEATMVADLVLLGTGGAGTVALLAAASLPAAVPAAACGGAVGLLARGQARGNGWGGLLTVVYALPAVGVLGGVDLWALPMGVSTALYRSVLDPGAGLATSPALLAATAAVWIAASAALLAYTARRLGRELAT